MVLLVMAVSNTVLGCYSTILNGFNNRITGATNCYSVIGGGSNNRVNNIAYGGILGGNFNAVEHGCSFVVGNNITTVRSCTTHVNQLYMANTPNSGVGLQLGVVYRDGTGRLFVKI